jgi:hypothetical protein
MIRPFAFALSDARAFTTFAALATFMISSVSGCSSASTNASSDAGAASDGSSGGDTGASADTGTGGALTCQDYCTTVMANCTATNQQFTGMDQCLGSCKAYPVGAASDKAGNTLGCRSYHAGAAKADATTHCVHSGPGGAGVCGANCDGYCQIAMMYCTAPNQAAVYATLAECKTACAAFPDTAKLDVTNTTLQEQKQVACLLYHSQEASVAPADHCNGDLAKDDAGNASATCNK